MLIHALYSNSIFQSLCICEHFFFIYSRILYVSFFSLGHDTPALRGGRPPGRHAASGARGGASRVGGGGRGAV